VKLRQVARRYPGAVVLLERALVGEHPEELLDVQGVAFGGGDDALEDGRLQ
jgi:hypothetical protein